jgi:hypothetical protein
MGNRGGAFRVWVVNPEGKCPLIRAKSRQGDNITMYLQELGWGGREWIDLAQNRKMFRALLNAEMNLTLAGPSIIIQFK